MPRWLALLASSLQVIRATLRNAATGAPSKQASVGQSRRRNKRTVTVIPREMKANFIGLIFLTLLIALFFSCTNYIFGGNPIIFPFIYIAWCLISVYTWEHAHQKINNAKDWLIIALYSIFGLAFLILAAIVEIYMTTGLYATTIYTTGSNIAEHINFSVFITILVAVSCCPGLTFIALAGAARALFIKQAA